MTWSRTKATVRVWLKRMSKKTRDAAARESRELEIARRTALRAEIHRKVSLLPVLLLVCSTSWAQGYRFNTSPPTTWFVTPAGGLQNAAGNNLCNTGGYFCTFTFDATGALRISGSISGGGDGAIQDGATPSIEATVLDYTNSNPLAVRLTDTNGDYTAAGGGTQYADGAAVATPTGTVALGHDGANVRAVTTDSSGDLQVDVLSGSITANAGTNLNTSALLTTSAHDAAFGTAGSADAQVRSIQGVASMTPVAISPSTVTANNDGACVSVTTGSTALLASFSTRKWASIVNQGTALVYIKFGATATSSDFPLPAGAAFNWPPGVSYTGAVDAISSSGTQSVCVVEF